MYMYVYIYIYIYIYSTTNFTCQEHCQLNNNDKDICHLPSQRFSPVTAAAADLQPLRGIQGGE